MILQGSQRGGPQTLARHLLNEKQNDHVELHQIHGLASEDLTSALLEIDASKGASKSNKPFYHLSFNPPPDGSPTVADFESAITQAERHLRLEGQPRAVVFHEKEGRRHAHVVWSRVNQDGKMIRISFDKRWLQKLSRSLYQQHGWHMPIGFEKGPANDPHRLQQPAAKLTNYRHDEWMQFQRTGTSPADHKRMIGSAYRHSDDLASFKQALEHQGYYLAAGYRGYIAVDLNGEPHSVMRAVGERKKAVETKLGPPGETQQPTVEQVQQSIQDRRTAAIEAQAENLKAAHRKEIKPYRRELDELRSKQRAQRRLFKGWKHQQLAHLETSQANRYRKGLKGLVDRFTGKAKRIGQENRREREELEAAHQAKKETMIQEQIVERRQLQGKMIRLTRQQRTERDGLRQDMAALLSFDRGDRLDLATDHAEQARTARQAERQDQASKHPNQKQARRRGRGMRRSPRDDPGPDEPA